AEGTTGEEVSCPPPPGESNEACPKETQQPVAQEQPAPAPAPEAPAQEWYMTLGYVISAGGGVSDFANTTMRDLTNTGGDWNVRLGVGTRSYVMGEVSYISSAQGINALGLENNATLVGNGAQLALRLNGTVNYPVQPFIFGGVAWRHYNLSHNGPNLSDVSNS